VSGNEFLFASRITYEGRVEVESCDNRVHARIYVDGKMTYLCVNKAAAVTIGKLFIDEADKCAPYNPEQVLPKEY
jgi:hypothetical protein